MTESAEIRTQLIEALKLDLIGPWAGHALEDEQLSGWERPSNWYLTGFLVPRDAPQGQRADDNADDDLESEVLEVEGLGDDSAEDRKAAKKSFFPSSMGLSFLVPAGMDTCDVVVGWGDYARKELTNAPNEPTAEEPAEKNGESQPPEAEAEESDPDAQAKSVSRKSYWQRTARQEVLTIPIPGVDTSKHTAVPHSGGLSIHVVARTINTGSFAGRIQQGTRSVSLFLVNERTPVPTPDQDEAFAFQVEMEVRSRIPFAPRPDLRHTSEDDWDEQIGDLHYQNAPEYATGHAVAAEWELVNGDCRLLRTAWTPTADVEKTETVRVPGVELSMMILGELPDGAAASAALTPLVTNYRSWIEVQRTKLDGLSAEHQSTAEELLRLAVIAADRIEDGILSLADDGDALDAFRVANRAVAEALSRRLNREGAGSEPCWRAFQLAFLLLNLPGIADPLNNKREIVDLLFFPTGGGKTEAYLGLAAFTMVLRRLRNPDDARRAGAGVSVIMRYTLRLLTLDQLGRAAGLVCALELERRKNVSRYGAWPFEIGLWVGKAGTPNHLGKKGDSRSDSARAKVTQYKNDPNNKPIPIPLEDCPWCGERFTPDSFNLIPNAEAPTDLRICCANFECDFSGDSPLPIVAVDEPLYRRLPAFLIATVDKFASLPWVGQSGSLLGGADRFDAQGFYGAAKPRYGQALSRPLPPPDLIIQDELHLIAGPLGTMAGLYEAAIESLCLQEVNGSKIKPKIVASTATVRRAQDQIQALFARSTTQIFPPPGPDRRDAFFAQSLPLEEKHGRRYMGIAAQGRNQKIIMRHVVLALMGSAQRAWSDCGAGRDKNNPADPYMTMLGYFNSLRELGGARRVLEEEVQNTLKRYSRRLRRNETQGLFRDRASFSGVVELTSRVSTDKVVDARRRLESPFHDRGRRVDCAIATNMISVGLDIQRLGLMVVNGQPKTHAEYIQATSRVGRDDQRPGLVVTLYNFHKPRDRSHYERFRHYHETFYRSVEVASVTPFAARALDRGFAGALVALARHADSAMTPPGGAQCIEAERTVLEARLLEAFQSRIDDQLLTVEERNERRRSVQDRIGDLLDSWLAIYADYRSNGVVMQYQRYEDARGSPLLREILDTDFESHLHQKFRANRSLRDLEPQVNLFLKTLGSKLDRKSQ